MLVSRQRLTAVWQRIRAPLLKRLQVVVSCGLTPQKLAMTLCLGTAFGVIPLVWGTSLICIVLAHVFRLNHLALQSVNYLLWPVHLALLAPFYKLGAWLLPWGPAVPQNLVAAVTSNSGLSSLHLFGWLTLKAIVAWILTVPPPALIAYVILRSTVLKTAGQSSKLPNV